MIYTLCRNGLKVDKLNREIGAPFYGFMDYILDQIFTSTSSHYSLKLSPCIFHIVFTCLIL